MQIVFIFLILIIIVTIIVLLLLIHQKKINGRRKSGKAAIDELWATEPQNYQDITTQIKLTKKRTKELEIAMNRLILENSTASSIEDLYLYINHFAGRLAPQEYKYCKDYLFRKASSSFDRYNRGYTS
jgi:predicted Holliday junction resolvase-like endonuclease